MNTQVDQASETLRDYAHLAVQKHFKKSVKYEADVLKDRDLEPLHQMRVGMRRLRTALQVFESVLDLPESAGDRQIKKIAQRLGAVRDLDVLEIALKERYRPHLKGKEQKKLDQVLESLQNQRDRQFNQIKKLFESQQYRKFKQSFKAWLDQPHYGAIASLPLLQVLPDLLLPLISHLLLHPGWLVSARVEPGKIDLPTSLDSEHLNQQLNEQAEVLHDLRKQMKRVRYQAEFFTDFYEPTYMLRVQEFQAVQEILGELQDYAILSDFLASVLQANWQEQIPTLAQQLEENRIRAWANWQPIQQQYLNPDFRAQLRHLVATPLKPSFEAVNH
ncbi:MAG: CHAD domain-containing protein [Leptolyngbyaceae cyanobacterium RM1_406_9]|nr:CHAD domain-containing protein [Leptolyngbyaceae cyanobacterium RM1_406_9]